MSPLHSIEVDVLVPPDGPLYLPLALGKSRGIEDDKVVFILVIPEKLEDIRLDQTMVLQRYSVENKVPFA
jgi:hypothetical protein